MRSAKRVAVIGLGPAGAITIDALVKEDCFDTIRVFERREGPGGCWNQESNSTCPPLLQNLQALSTRIAADPPVLLPATFPAYTAKTRQSRFAESSIYPYLETNVTALAMEFSQEPFPTEISPWSRGQYGPDSPFRHWEKVNGYIEAIATSHSFPGLVEYNTTVERCEKIGEEWKLTLRREEGQARDFWWEEKFDAVVVASGHWSVPYIPSVPGLEEFERERAGSVLHSKYFRGREAFRGKRVIVVGASVSAADISIDLLQTALLPIHSVVLGHTPNIFFGNTAFQHPQIQQRPSISHISPSSRTIHFIDGTSLQDVDHIIFGTGYSWTIPFLPQVSVRNNRVPDLFQHVIWRHDPSLLFIGAVGPGLTFKIFEWQAVLAARVLAGRTTLPPAKIMERWEAERIQKRGDGPKFTLVYPDLEEYFETVRKLAGEGVEEKGRKLIPFRREWMESFEKGVQLRIEMWKKLNAEARKEISVQKDGTARTLFDEDIRHVVSESPRL